MLEANWFTNTPHRDYNRMPGGVWLRSLQLFPYLEALGVHSSYNEITPGARVACFVRWQDAEAYALAAKLKAEGRRIVFDLNVNYLDVADVPHVGRPVGEAQVAEARRMLAIADVVTCASPHIAQRVAREHDHPVLLEDSLDARHFSGVKDPADFGRARLRVLWNGWSHKAQELTPLLPLLADRDLDLVLVTDKPPALRATGWLPRRFPYRFLRWRYERFPADLLQGEVCIAPRQLDNAYNLGHSLAKIGLPMVQGVPAVADPVPSYKPLLARGGGRLCGGLEDWERTLDAVLDDREILARWSREARQAAQPFTTENLAPRYASLFRELAGAAA